MAKKERIIKGVTPPKIGRLHDDLYIMVTPQMAEELLNRNTHNRPLRPGVVESYARDMKAGRWQRNAQPVTIDWNDAIHNGQHRLFAVVESGVTVPLMILSGLDPATVLTVDTGVARSYADYRKIKDGNEEGTPLKNLASYQAAVRLIHWYENKWPGHISAGREGKATHQELDEIAGRYPHLNDALSFVQARNGPVRRIINPTILGFVYGLGVIEHPSEADRWVETIWSNEGAPNNPAISYRARFTAARISGHVIDRATAICFTIKSWNAFAQGHTLAQLRWQDDEPMPAIYGTPHYTGKLAGRRAVAEKLAEGGHKTLGKRRPKV